MATIALVLLVLGFWPPSPAKASVFLSIQPDEVRRLLGLNRELSYVRDGFVHTNAVNFNIPIAADLDAIHFLWYNSGKESVGYKIVIALLNDLVKEASGPSMHQPSVNISHTGHVPTVPSTWRVSLPCAGHREAKVDVAIDITFSGKGFFYEIGQKRATDSAHLRLRRSKFCSADNASSTAADVNWAKKNDASDRPNLVNGAAAPHMVFLGAVLSAIIGIVVMVICVVIIHMRSKDKLQPGGGGKKHHVAQMELHSQPLITTTSATSTTTFMANITQQHQHHIYEPAPAVELHYAHSLIGNGIQSGNTWHGAAFDHHLVRPDSRVSNFELRQRYPPANFGDVGVMSDAAETRVTDWIQQQQQLILEDKPSPETDPQMIFDDLLVDRIRLKLGSLLQEGTFSRVYQGLFESDSGSGCEQDVMIKTVLTGSSATQSQLLIHEGVRLQSSGSGGHKNVLQLLAATWDGTSPMLIYPYSAQGNVKQYLTKFASGGLSTHQVVRMGIHLLSAVAHLHKRNIVHKDVAARNCFLAEGSVLKLSDSALSRDLFPADYHCLGDNENRPIKWMPPEAIAKSNFSRASDIWSCGVVLWELMTRAQQPFADVDPFEMEAYLNEGYRLHQPMNCPDQLYSVLASCWDTRPQQRASLQQLHQSLQALQRQLQQFV